jgi:hypothetical protein
VIPWCRPWCRFGDCLSTFNAAVKVEIYLSQDVDCKEDTAPGSNLLLELEKSPFMRVSIYLHAGLLRVSQDLRDVLLSSGSLRLNRGRDGAGWSRSITNVD